ncbi:MAG: N-methyl-D-aspartate receptor NMDAR2C subunit [Candidatus Nealsonbacteria bacterium]|nr:N-methyl-D-aspartate receptor NMDAR2C subunit [Candidatus Nealsonbacteria bacterium]
MEKNNKKRWVELWQRAGRNGGEDAGDCAVVYAHLISHHRGKYEKSPRLYHTIDHIDRCLEEFDEVKGLLTEPNAVEMAIWFHDFFYDTYRKDNEKRSAGVAKDILKAASLPHAFGKRVTELILVTKHDIPPADFDARIIADIDLASLGYSEKIFDENTAKIRKEYDWVPKEIFNKGRIKILKAFLDRPTIYLTQFFRDKYEAQARKNLARAIAKLLE